MNKSHCHYFQKKKVIVIFNIYIYIYKNKKKVDANGKDAVGPLNPNDKRT